MKKEKALLCEVMELDELLERTVCEAFKYLYATIDCYKDCKDKDKECCCKCCCKCKHERYCEDQLNQIRDTDIVSLIFFIKSIDINLNS